MIRNPTPTINNTAEKKWMIVNDSFSIITDNNTPNIGAQANNTWALVAPNDWAE